MSSAPSPRVQAPGGSATATQTVGTCSQQLVSQFNSILSAVNSTVAVDLAVKSAQFQDSVAGHGYAFTMLYSTDTYNSATCSDVALGELAVSFAVEGVTVSSGRVTVPESITVFENPAITNVTSVTVDRDVHGFTYFSGWESYDQVSGVTQQEYYSETSFNMPSSVSWNANCYHASPWQCEMSPWDGLSYGAAGSGFLMQSGTDIKIPCTSQTSCNSTPTLSAWWECLSGTSCNLAAQPCGNSYPVSLSDHINAFEENGGYSGGNGNGNDYEAFVQDTTASPHWLCGSGWQDMASSSYPYTEWAQSIIEMPSSGCCPVPTSWGTLTFTALMCPGSSSSSCIFYPSSYDSINQMDNYCTATGVYYFNINVGSYSSSNGQFTEQYNNNCDF